MLLLLGVLSYVQFITSSRRLAFPKNVLFWKLQRLCGPNFLAYRPLVWRGAALLVVHKAGDVAEIGNWRLIFVMVQCGLVQEAILSNRVKPSVLAHLEKGQSGYVLGTEVPHLLLHELLSCMRAQSRATWLVLGDFHKAFPRVLRCDLTVQLSEVPGFTGGVMHELGSILQIDRVHVWLSGDSIVDVVEGIPEGGHIGTLGYTSIPNSLSKLLMDAGHGVGVDVPMPPEWADHKWSGRGVPQDALVDLLLMRIPIRVKLPQRQLLEVWPDLEASAARALDLMAPRRYVVVLSADDPVFLASSCGAMEQLLTALSEWARCHNAVFHLGAKKNSHNVLRPTHCKTLRAPGNHDAW